MKISELDAFLKAHGVKHYSAAEVTRLHRLQKCSVPPSDLWPNIVATLHMADAIRSEWGHPVRVFSGYRTEAYNISVGGAPNSQHLHFRALDLAPANGKIAEFQKLVKKIVRQWREEGNLVGLGTYASFCHIDVGWKTRDWQG